MDHYWEWLATVALYVGVCFAGLMVGKLLGLIVLAIWKAM